jgi:dCMP deaminase
MSRVPGAANERLEGSSLPHVAGRLLGEGDLMEDKDAYYMSIAKAVEGGADCLGTHVGALIVRENRIISTGYNGTPSGFPNCNDGGCVRCRDSQLFKEGRVAEMSSAEHVQGAALDKCVCVHAEQNAFLTAARFGIEVQDAVLYSTWSPCFTCLKEAVQVGVKRIVYREWYKAKYEPAIRDQYFQMVDHLTGGDKNRFAVLPGTTGSGDEMMVGDPFEDPDATPMEPPST